LPDVFAKLSSSGGHNVETGITAGGGWMLSDAISSKDTQDGLASKKWDYVVLQEQSQTPAPAESRTMFMLPAVRELTGFIYPTGAIPILFITWGHRDDWPDNGLPDYEQYAKRDQCWVYGSFPGTEYCCCPGGLRMANGP
jgi:hypothetical protein